VSKYKQVSFSIHNDSDIGCYKCKRVMAWIYKYKNRTYCEECLYYRTKYWENITGYPYLCSPEDFYIHTEELV